MSKLLPPKPRNTNPLEKVIETKVCKHAEALGCLQYKFTSPSRRSVPDRLFILPGGKGMFFIEFKRRGEKPTEKQALEIAKIQETGTAVFVVDNVERGLCVIADMMHPKRVINEFGIAKFQENQRSKKITMDDPFFN